MSTDANEVIDGTETPSVAERFSRFKKEVLYLFERVEADLGIHLDGDNNVVDPPVVHADGGGPHTDPDTPPKQGGQ